MNIEKYLQKSPDINEGIPEKIERTEQLGNTKKRILDCAQYFSSKNGVLDIGPAAGWETKYMTETFGWDVTAITIFDEEVELIKKNAPKAKVFKYDMHGLPINWDNKYGFIFASHVLEHSPAPYVALKEWYRVLRKGGYAFIVMPDANGYTGLQREKPTRIGNMPAHLFCGSCETTIELIRHAGFTFTRYNEIPQMDGDMVTYYNRIWICQK